MGYGMLMGQETRLLSKIESQTVLSAYENGVLSNAKEVNTCNHKANVNKPHLVNSTSTNPPSDLSWGIREVFFYSNTDIIIRITGIDKNSNARIWQCVGTVNGSIFTIGEWKSTDDDLTVFQNDEPNSTSITKFWVNTNEEESDKIMLPEINDGETNSIDTWSSKKIDETIKNVKTEIEDYIDSNSGGLSIVTELGSDEVNDETVTLKKITMGQYMIFGGTDTAVTIEDDDTHYVSFDRVLKTIGDNISDYVNLVDGLIFLKAGTYLISGKVQITSSTIQTSVSARWLTSPDNTTFYSSAESQNAETYLFVDSGTVQAKVALTETIITLATDTYLRLEYKPYKIGKLVVSPEACRLQVVKIR